MYVLYISFLLILILDSIPLYYMCVHMRHAFLENKKMVFMYNLEYHVLHNIFEQ